MIDPIASVARLPSPVVARSDAAPAAPAPTPAPETGADDGGEAAAKPAPLSLSVDRDDAGVFVYTLTDSSSGRVLAVIPRSAVALAASPAEGVDMQA